MLAAAVTPSRAGLASSARRAAVPLRGAGTARPRPARRLCCQPAAHISAADAAARVAEGVTVGAALHVIGPLVYLCGQKAARRLLPRLADRPGWQEQPAEAVSDIASWSGMWACLGPPALHADLEYATVTFAAGALVCFIKPALELLFDEYLRPPAP